jgi:hypothetical protein
LKRPLKLAWSKVDANFAKKQHVFVAVVEKICDNPLSQSLGAFDVCLLANIQLKKFDTICLNNF